MKLYLIIFVACLPIILLCTYIYHKDKDKEPGKILRKLFIFGVLSIIPIIGLELLTNKIAIFDKENIVSLFINVFITIGLIEEGMKWVIVNKSVYNNIEFNHAYDAIIYCVFASLGFALIENIFYVYGEGLTIGILRGVTTIPAHTFNGVIMGYFLGKSKQEDINKNSKNAKKYMFLSLLIPILCHSLYDFLIIRGNTIAVILFILMVIVMYILIIIIIRKTSIINNNFDGSKYDSKDRIKYESDSDLFIDALVKVLMVTLVLIAISALILL